MAGAVPGSDTRRCHYCGTGGILTRDHIVPRYRVRSLRLPGNHPFFNANVVPACGPCNTRKGGGRGPCVCEKCRYAWSQFMLLKIGVGKVLA